MRINMDYFNSFKKIALKVLLWCSYLINILFLGLIIWGLINYLDIRKQPDRIGAVSKYLCRSSHQYREVIYELGKPLTYKEFKVVLESSVDDKTEIHIEDNVISLNAIDFRFKDNKLKEIYIPYDYGDFD